MTYQATLDARYTDLVGIQITDLLTPTRKQRAK